MSVMNVNIGGGEPAHWSRADETTPAMFPAWGVGRFVYDRWACGVPVSIVDCWAGGSLHTGKG